MLPDEHRSLVQKEDMFARLTSHPDGQGSMLRISEGNSFRGTIFNLITSIIGAGVLGLPFAVQQSGVVIGVFLLIFVAGLTDLSVWMLLVCVDATRELSYSMVVEQLYGRWLGVCVDCIVLFNNFGVLVGYLVVIGDLIHPFMTFLDAPAALQDRTVLMSVIVLCALLPLSLMRSMRALRHASLIYLFVVLVVLMVMVAMGTGIIDVSRADDAKIVLLSESPKDMICPVSVMVFAYACHMNVPIIYGELRRKTGKFRSKRTKMMIAFHISVGLCAVFYTGVGVFGYLAFRNRTHQDILTNLDYHTFSAAPYIKVSYSLVIVCSYPVMVFSSVASLHRLLQHIKEAGGRGVYKYQPFQAFSPSCGASPLGQSVMWSPPPSPPPEKAGDAMPKEELEAPGVDEHNLFFHLPESPSRATSEPEASSAAPPSEIMRVTEVVGIVIVSLFTSLYVPGVSVVFALTGGVCGGSLTFIFPGMCFLKVHSGIGRCCRWCLGHGVLWFGVLVGLATTTITVKKLM